MTTKSNTVHEVYRPEGGMHRRNTQLRDPVQMHFFKEISAEKVEVLLEAEAEGSHF